MKGSRRGLYFYSKRSGMACLCCSGDGSERSCVPELEEREPLPWGGASQRPGFGIFLVLCPDRITYHSPSTYLEGQVTMSIIREVFRGITTPTHLSHTEYNIFPPSPACTIPWHPYPTSPKPASIILWRPPPPRHSPPTSLNQTQKPKPRKKIYPSIISHPTNGLSP